VVHFAWALRFVVGSLGEADASGHRVRSATCMTRRLQKLQHVRRDETMQFFTVHRLLRVRLDVFSALCNLRKKVTKCAKIYPGFCKDYCALWQAPWCLSGSARSVVAGDSEFAMLFSTHVARLQGWLMQDPRMRYTRFDKTRRLIDC
jgi:hypothetical protein